ncbi:hypothetical protein QK309_15220, partial [Klebsiella quasipneumoniae]|nr:hypothetical protein [Klebsiella quasipneumoniae]
MRKILVFLCLLFCCSEVVAKCDYFDSTGTVLFNLSPKIATDPTIPVGTVLYGFVNGMVASHLLCHSGTINRHSLNGALL